MREVLEAAAIRMRDQALEQWRFESLCYLLAAPYAKRGKRIKPPGVPPILR
jgi:hypothetical protein